MVVADNQAAEIPQPGDRSLDHPTPLVAPKNAAILWRCPAAVQTEGRDQHDAPPSEPLSQSVTVIALVGNDPQRFLPGTPRAMPPAYADRRERRLREPDFRRGRRTKVVRQRNSAAVDHHHPLRALAPLGFSDFGAPFLAGAKLPSRNDSLHFNCWRSFNSLRNARQMFNQTPCSSQSRNRRQQVEGCGYFSGRSCQRAPLRRIQRIPSKTRRLSIHGRPPRRCLGGFGSKGAIFFHCASVNNGPDRAIGPPSALLALLMHCFGRHNHHLFRRLYQVMQQLLEFQPIFTSPPKSLQEIFTSAFSEVKPAESGDPSRRAIREGNMANAQRKLFWLSSLGISLSFAALLVTTNMGAATCASGGNRPPGAQGWRLAQPVTYRNLTIFPVVSSEGADTSAFATLDDALASGDAIVTEQGSYLHRTRDGSSVPDIEASAQVNQLVLINRGKKPLLLLAGEVVSGGKQDRIIGKDRIVPAGAAPLPLDVFCVEHGRWTGASSQFSVAKTMVHPSVRERAAIDQDQGQVWAAISGDAVSGLRTEGGQAGGLSAAPPAVSRETLSHVIASAAPTNSYRKIYQSSSIGTSVEAFALEFERRFNHATSDLKGGGVVGVVVAYGGEVAWSDIFASPELFDAYWQKLLRSYVVEALTRPMTIEKVSLDDARDFLRPATGHIQEESDPGVYRWIEQSEGRVAQIELEALQPKPLTLHWLKVWRAS